MRSNCRAMTLIEVMILVILALLLIGAIIGGVSGCGNQGQGVVIGTLSSFRVEGLINKSGEGVLVMDGFKAHSNQQGGPHGGVSNTWEFSCDRETVYPQLEAAVGHRVKLWYDKTAFNTGWTAKRSSRVSSVQVLD